VNPPAARKCRRSSRAFACRSRQPIRKTTNSQPRAPPTLTSKEAPVGKLQPGAEQEGEQPVPDEQEVVRRGELGNRDKASAADPTPARARVATGRRRWRTTTENNSSGNRKANQAREHEERRQTQQGCIDGGVAAAHGPRRRDRRGSGGKASPTGNGGWLDIGARTAHGARPRARNRRSSRSRPAASPAPTARDRPAVATRRKIMSRPKPMDMTADQRIPRPCRLIGQSAGGSGGGSAVPRLGGCHDKLP